MDETCSTNIKIWMEQLKTSCNSEYLGVDGNTIHVNIRINLREIFA